MTPPNEKFLIDLGTRVRFFDEMGAEFILKERSAGKKKTPRPDIPVNIAEAFEGLKERILRCERCGLSRQRTQAVPGEGSFGAGLMFIGEGPGHDEDVLGRPFVGRAGQLLTKIIQAMQFERGDVYITNIVKCRPPENRTPHREEVETCSPYLLEQIDLIKPRVIVTLGKVATDFFVPGGGAMGALRGRFCDFHGIRVMPTFHPSYLIRNESNKEIRRSVWMDMQQVMEVFGKK